MPGTPPAVRGKCRMTTFLAVQEVAKVFTMGGLLRPQVRPRGGQDASLSRSTPRRPEIFTIIGESGSGKTTLARMILNLVPPTGRDLVSRQILAKITRGGSG